MGHPFDAGGHHRWIILAGHEAQDCDSPRLRASHEADAAPGASGTRVDSGAITVVIEMVTHGDEFWRTSFNAKAAAFALVRIDLQLASIFLSDFRHSLLL
jgi:hypothetical protein